MGIVALCAALGGCVSTGETIAFRTSNPQQQAMVRDGQPALVSRQKSSLVLVRPAARQLQANGRPVFVVGINNVGRQPTDFRMAQVEAVQHVGSADFQMQVVTFEMLQQEEKNRQVAAAILTGVAGAANSYSASRAGYGTYTTPGGEIWSATARTSRLNRDDFGDINNTVASVPTGYDTLEVGWRGRLFGEKIDIDLGVEAIEPAGGERDVNPYGFVRWTHAF